MSAAPGAARWGWWTAVAAWMAVIFCASLAYLSGDHTGRFLAELLQRLHLTINSGVIDRANFLLRKAAHLTEYAILAALLYAALRRTVPGPRPWRPGVAALAFALAAAYAAGDEYHQSFVPGRTSAVHDVAIDAAGAAIGLALARRRLQRKSEEQASD